MTIAPLGPRQHNLCALGDQLFEELCFRLARIESPGAAATANPDGGADVLLRASGGGFVRAWQAKHHTSGIAWKKCRESLDRAVETYGVTWMTFCFPIRLTKDRHLRFDAELVSRHPDVRVDSWDAAEIQARLTVSAEGQRVARHYFGDSAHDSALITRAIRAGGDLGSIEAAIERLHPVGEFLDDHDPFFTYPQYQYKKGEAPPAARGSLISLESGDGERVVRIDAVPRDAEAADRYRPTLRLRFEGPGGREAKEQFEQAIARSLPITVDRGVTATFVRLPPAFAGRVDNPFPASISINPVAEAWDAEFRVLTASEEESMCLKMVQADTPPAGWDVEHVGRAGGLAVSILGRFSEGDERVGINWTYTIDDSPAREQLASLRFIAALHERGELIVRERGKGKQFLRETNKPLPIPEHLPRLLSLFGDVVVIEDWVGFDIPVPREISADELAQVSFIADAIRSRRTPFREGYFELVGDATAIPHLMKGANMAIGEAWFVEILGQELELGRRTVHFRPKAVRDEGEVEPGRNAVQIEPDDEADPDGLFWEIEAPRELGQAKEAA